MKQMILISLAIYLSMHASAQPIEMMQLRDDGIAQWRYQEGDEFNDQKIDKTKWRKSYPWGRNLGNNMLQYYADDNTFLKDGLLIMEARKQDTIARGIPYWKAKRIMDDGSKNERTFNYTSGMLFSQEKYFEGYFEAKLKTSKGNGFFPAFWLYGANPNEEVDIIEAKGERPNSYHVDMHCANGCSDYHKILWWKTSSYGDWIDSDEDLSADFHLYAGEWVPGEIVFYMDDQAKDQWAGNLEHPASVIFNFGVSGREGGSSFDGGIDDTTPFPQTFEVDYVRIYKRADEGWESKEKAKLNKKGRKKKKGKKKTSQRVRATARVFVDNERLRVETSGEEKFDFRIVDSHGNSLKDFGKDLKGDLEFDLKEINEKELWLVTSFNGFSRKTQLRN